MGPIVWSQSDIRDRYLPRCTMHGQHIDLFRRAAPHVDRILRGAKPSELPVQVPFKYENDDQSEDGQGAVVVPLSLQQIADEVIE